MEGVPASWYYHIMRTGWAAMVLLASMTLVSGCATTAGYLWKEAGPFIHYSFGATSVETALKDPHTPPQVKELLDRVQSIKQYAVHDIGLANNGNYTAYKSLDRDYLVNVVSACDALSFTPYLWSYPFLGKLPYRGFYSPDDARAEADRLKALGYDVVLRKVDAFSTLGFFKDPVYSFMDTYSLYDLADTIIHEQTHATLFLKGQPDFNEELATFVGDTGGLGYVASARGADSQEYKDAQAQQTDQKLFLSFLAELRHALEQVYNSGLDAAEKRLEKEKIIAQFQTTFAMQYVPQFSSSAYRSVKELPLNNAYLALYDLYTSDIPLLADFDRLVCGGDLRTFVTRIVELSKKPGDMLAKIRAALPAD